MEVIIYIILFIAVSILIMVVTNIMYDLSSAILPIITILIISAGIAVGFGVAIKNTFIVYRDIYFKKGK